VTCERSVVFYGYSEFLHQYNYDRHDIFGILLKVALNTISLILVCSVCLYKLLCSINIREQPLDVLCHCV